MSDNGAGIAPENQARIFQPYFTTKKTGTGLGLFVSRKLVSEHGGSMDFESHPGEGTVFRIRLPQGTGVRGQGSGVREPGSGVRGQESGVRGQESGVRGQGSGVREPGSGEALRE